MIRELLADMISEPYSISPIHGGDINETFLVTKGDQEFFVKYHHGSYAMEMFQKEEQGLKLINLAVPGFAPEVIARTSIGNHACLILEFIKSGPDTVAAHASLAEQLVKLHTFESDKFGLDQSNFIGSLTQYNTPYGTISEFMVLSRLEPQLKLAQDSNYLASGEIPSTSKMIKTLEDIIPEEKPCLIHGDLWSGNYLITNSGKSMIIDPAVAFVHREMDIAMSKLFGGFSTDFYRFYNEYFPLVKGWQQRIDLFQLYYILVHLNLFGISYKGSAMRIIKKWFN